MWPTPPLPDFSNTVKNADTFFFISSVKLISNEFNTVREGILGTRTAKEIRSFARWMGKIWMLGVVGFGWLGGDGDGFG